MGDNIDPGPRPGRIKSPRCCIRSHVVASLYVNVAIEPLRRSVPEFETSEGS